MRLLAKYIYNCMLYSLLSGTISYTSNKGVMLLLKVVAEPLDIWGMEGATASVAIVYFIMILISNRLVRPWSARI
jgi:hypothetical protein